MLRVAGAATLKVRYEVDLPISEGAFEALPTEQARAMIAEAIKSQANSDAQTSNIDIYDYEQVGEQND